MEWTCNGQSTDYWGGLEVVEHRRLAVIKYQSWKMVDEQMYILPSRKFLQEAQAFTSHVDTWAHESKLTRYVFLKKKRKKEKE